MRIRALPLALALSAATASARPRSFRMPSKQIGCRYDDRGPEPLLRCDPLFLDDRAFVLGRVGRGRRVHVTDTVYRRDAAILRYGRSLRLGPLTCASRRRGLTCRNRRNGHGFFVSRERQRAF